MFEKQMKQWMVFDAGTIFTNYHLYRGDEAREAGRTEEARTHYKESLERVPENVDALIGMYRVSLPEQQVQERRGLLKSITKKMRESIREGEEVLKLVNNQSIAFTLDDVANKSNTLAWLIANTEGSKEEALFLSRRACTLQPKGPSI